MKLVLVRGVIFLGAALLAAQEPAAPEVLRSADGVALRNPRILSFNGAVFQIEHAEGAIGIPWDRMPPGWRRGYTFAPPVTSTPAPKPTNLTQTQGDLLNPDPRPPGKVVMSEPDVPKRSDAVEDSTDPSPTPAPVSKFGRPLTSSSTVPIRPPAIPDSNGKPAGSLTEVEVPLGTPILMRAHGGYDKELFVTSVDQGSINLTIGDATKAQTHFSNRTSTRSYTDVPQSQMSVPRRPSFSNQRQLIYQDAAGAKVYFIEGLGGKDGHVRLAIERGRGGPETININRLTPYLPGMPGR